MSLKLDQGLNFGKWADPTSKFLYEDSTQYFLTWVETRGTVVDLGGGNGLLKKHIPNLITVDIDPEKQPDIVADILTFQMPCDLIILRYVLHYLTDKEVHQLFDNIRSFHHGAVLIIQFFNNDATLPVKRQISAQAGEQKYFRNETELFSLIPSYTQRHDIQYQVHPLFYKNRLGIQPVFSHQEVLTGVLL